MKRWWSYSADLLTGTDSPPGVYRGRFQRRSISSKSFRRIAQFAGGFSAQASVQAVQAFGPASPASPWSQRGGLMQTKKGNRGNCK